MRGWTVLGFRKSVYAFPKDILGDEQ
jgi:hypothetical protein